MHHDSEDYAWFIFNLHTRILTLYINNMQSIIWVEHLFARIKAIPSYLEGWCLAHGGEFRSTLVPCLLATVHSLLSYPPHTFLTPFSPHYVTMMISTITIFLSGTGTNYAPAYTVHTCSHSIAYSWANTYTACIICKTYTHDMWFYGLGSLSDCSMSTQHLHCCLYIFASYCKSWSSRAYCLYVCLCMTVIFHLSHEKK